MKYSIYNSLIKVSPKIALLFNSFTDSFIFLNAAVTDLLETPAVMKEKHLDLYRKMVQREFYVFNKIDEFERLATCVHRVLRDEDYYFLIINPTMDCNLNCWYCYERHEKSIMSRDVYQRVLSLIKRKIESGIRNFTLGFFGGEPLMKFKSIVMPLIDYTYELCQQQGVKMGVFFTTNGTLLTASRVEELCRYGNPSFQITLDGNDATHNTVRYFANKKGTYSLIMQNIRVLLEHHCSVRLRINYTQENVHTLSGILQDVSTYDESHKKLLVFDFHRVWQDRGGERVLSEIKEYSDQLVKQGFQVLYDDLNTINHACYGDKVSTAVVNYNGDVFKCTAKDFCKENREGVLLEDGIIKWEKSQEYRLSLKFKNQTCRTCSIAPLCGSGCSRYILDREKENKSYCLFNNDRKAMDQFILDHVEKIVRIGYVRQQ